MKLLLEYARCACASFKTPAHGQMLANAFGAIIGSLQGTDPQSPEVAVVVASLGILCDRIDQIIRRDSISSGSSIPRGDVLSIETGLSVLIIGLELIPSTAIDPVWELIVELVERQTPRLLRMTLIELLAKQVGKMQVSSRRSELVRRIIQSGFQYTPCGDTECKRSFTRPASLLQGVHNRAQFDRLGAGGKEKQKPRIMSAASTTPLPLGAGLSPPSPRLLGSGRLQRSISFETLGC